MKKKILIILMTDNSENKYKKDFKSSFRKLKAILFFKKWYDKDLLLFIININIDAIIITGSEYRILKNTKKASIPKKILKLNIPIIGICYGYQWIIKTLCGKKCLNTFKNDRNNKKNYLIKINEPFNINKNYYKFNHHDYVTKIPKKWIILIKRNKQIWMSYNKEKKIIGIQFHPEATKIGKVFYKKWLNYISIIS